MAEFFSCFLWFFPTRHSSILSLSLPSLHLPLCLQSPFLPFLILLYLLLLLLSLSSLTIVITTC